MNIIEEIAQCVEFGKVNQTSPFPPEMKGRVGADELTIQALKQGISPHEILNQGFVVGMDRIGKKFSEKKVFVPHLLMSAKAMSTAMKHIKPFFQSGDVQRKGKFVIGTVAGDLHEIGKNLVAMMIEGSGWEVIDLGVDVKSEKFIEVIKQTPNCAVGLSALLTTTMVNMAKIAEDIKAESQDTTILIGGAPVDQDFCNEIGADFYSSDPLGAVQYLKSIAG